MGMFCVHHFRRVKHHAFFIVSAADKSRASNVSRYRFLARRTDAKFNKVVLQRLFLSRSKKQPLSISKIARYYPLPTFYTITQAHTPFSLLLVPLSRSFSLPNSFT